MKKLTEKEYRDWYAWVLKHYPKGMTGLVLALVGFFGKESWMIEDSVDLIKDKEYERLAELLSLGMGEDGKLFFEEFSKNRKEGKSSRKLIHDRFKAIRDAKLGEQGK